MLFPWLGLAPRALWGFWWPPSQVYLLILYRPAHYYLPLFIPYQILHTHSRSIDYFASRMRSQSLLGLAYLSSSVTAVFVGLGALAYDPVCCYACRAAISSAPLSCSGTGHGGGHSHGAPPTSPDCRATDSAFLTTLAYCINSNCDAEDVPVWKLERYWADQTTGDPSIPPIWNYGTALEQVKTGPTVTYTRGTTLNATSLVSQTAYETQRNFMVVFEKETAQEHQYA